MENVVGRDARGRERRLQFGHGGEAVENDRRPGRPDRAVPRFDSAAAVEAVENVVTCVGNSGVTVLHSGHGGEAVEDDLEANGRRSSGRSSFNGATAGEAGEDEVDSI